MRPILALRWLNVFIHCLRFRMITQASIIPSLNKDDLFIAHDLKDAYFHLDIHPAHKRMLSVTMIQNHYHYRVLPFCLALAPRIFTKVLSIVVAHFH